MPAAAGTLLFCTAQYVYVALALVVALKCREIKNISQLFSSLKWTHELTPSVCESMSVETGEEGHDMRKFLGWMDGWMDGYGWMDGWMVVLQSSLSLGYRNVEPQFVGPRADCLANTPYVLVFVWE